VKQRWASKALSDMDAIRDHSLKHWGSAQTAHYLRTIRDAVAAASQAPMQSAPADHYRPGYRASCMRRWTSTPTSTDAQSPSAIGG